MDEVLEQAAAAAGRYLHTLADRAVAPEADALAGLSALGGPLPMRGEPAAAVLEKLDRIAGPGTIASNGPRYFGFVIGGFSCPRHESVSAKEFAAAGCVS